MLYGQPSTLINTAGTDNPNDFYLRHLDRTDNFLNDNSYDAKVDYHIPFKVSDDFSGTLSAGGKYHKFDRICNGVSNYFGIISAASTHAVQILNWLKQNINPNASGVNLYGVSALNFLNSKYTPPTFLNGTYKLDTWGFDMGILNSLGKQWYISNTSQYWADGPQSYNSDI